MLAGGRRLAWWASLRQSRWCVVVLLVSGTLLALFACPSGAWASDSLGWSVGAEAGLPSNASANPNATVDSVWCASAGNCTAVGEYLDSSGNQQGLLLTESDGVGRRD